MNTRIPLIFSFLAIFLLSFLALVSAFVLGWAEKSTVIPFLAASVILAIIASAIGTSGKISLAELASFLQNIRRSG